MSLLPHILELARTKASLIKSINTNAPTNTSASLITDTTNYNEDIDHVETMEDLRQEITVPETQNKILRNKSIIITITIIIIRISIISIIIIIILIIIINLAPVAIDRIVNEKMVMISHAEGNILVLVFFSLLLSLGNKQQEKTFLYQYYLVLAKPLLLSLLS